MTVSSGFRFVCCVGIVFLLSSCEIHNHYNILNLDRASYAVVTSRGSIEIAPGKTASFFSRDFPLDRVDEGRMTSLTLRGAAVPCYHVVFPRAAQKKNRSTRTRTFNLVILGGHVHVSPSGLQPPFDSADLFELPPCPDEYGLVPTRGPPPD